MAGHAPKISIKDITDAGPEDDADDEYFDSQNDLSRQTTSTFTQQVMVAEEVTAEDSNQVNGQITGQVTEVEATKPIRDVKGKLPTSQKVKVSQATGTITGQLPSSQNAKQVKISGRVTEVSATQELTDPPIDQTARPGIGSSTPQSSRSIRKAISAVLDGSPFRRSSSNNDSKSHFKYSEELNISDHPTPQPKPISQTAADPPRPPMLGYEWVWFPAGYWAEREVTARPTKHIRPPKWVRRSLQESAGSTFGSPLASAPRSLNASEVWLKHPDDVEDMEDGEERGTGADGPHRRRASTPPDMVSPDRATPDRGTPDRSISTPKNLFRKLQRISHSRRGSASGQSTRKGKEPEEPRPESPPIDLERRTTNTLRGTSHFFSRFLAIKRQNERAMHPMSPNDQALKLPRKRFGLAPWHQNSSGDTVRSTTSSIRDLLFGKTPVSTPRPAASLADAKPPDQYFGVEVPGSRTASDWPLPTEGLQQDNTPRSVDQGTLESRRGSAVGSPLGQAESSGPSSLSNPYSGSSMAPMTSKAESAHLRDREGEPAHRGVPSPSERGNFATELTEHFRYSPLCPLHPTYKLAGMRYCPYHS